MKYEVIKGKRAIAYFDILGFKKKVAELSIDELADSYIKLIKNTENYELDIESGQILKKDTCKRFVFSDSIFLIANEDTDQGFVDLFSYAWRMMQMAFAMKFPLRGAITYGDVYIEQTKGIFIGKAIVDAAVLESRQDWIGAIVDKTAMIRYKNIFEGDDLLHQLYNILLPVYSVPLKDGTIEESNVINWRTNIVSQHGIKALFHNESGDVSVEKKIQNTLAFAKVVVEKRLAYLKDGIIPCRYRRFYIVDHDPNLGVPIKNGDEY